MVFETSNAQETTGSTKCSALDWLFGQALEKVILDMQ
jgi:hypothetical protein